MGKEYKKMSDKAGLPPGSLVYTGVYKQKTGSVFVSVQRKRI